MQLRRGIAPVIAALALVAAACGESAGTTAASSPAPTSGFPCESPKADWKAIEAAAKKEGQVDIRSTYVESIERKILAGFQDKYGITMNYSKKGGSGPTEASFLTEVQAGQNLVDGLQMSIAASQDVVDKGLAANVTLPNDSTLLDTFKVTGPAGMRAMSTSIVAVVYNSKLVQAGDVPKTYQELIDPKWKAKMVMGSPQNSGTILTWAYTVDKLYGPNYLTSLGKQNVLIQDKEVDGAALLARGERSLAVMDATAPTAQIVQGAPLVHSWIPQTPVLPAMILIPKRAPHPNAACLFANWVISKDAQTKYVTDHHVYAVVKGAPAPTGFPDIAGLKPTAIDPAIIIKERASIIAKWTTAFGG